MKHRSLRRILTHPSDRAGDIHWEFYRELVVCIGDKVGVACRSPILFSEFESKWKRNLRTQMGNSPGVQVPSAWQ